MTCKECNTRNPIGNKFCRECGQKIVIPEGSLAAEEAERAENERRAERAAVLLADAHLLAEQGKYNGAIPIVEEAIALAPFSTSAYTLLVTLYEHTDQMERAVSAQSRLVELQPEAEAEVTRLERLKCGERTSPPPARVSAGNIPTLRGPGSNPDSPAIFPQWVPLTAAVAGGAVMLFLGYIAFTPRTTFKPTTNTTNLIASPVVVAQASQENVIPVNPNAAPPPAADIIRGSDPFAPINQTRRDLQAEAARRNGIALSPVPTTTAPIPPKALGANRQPSVPGPAVRTSNASNSPVVVGIVKTGTSSDEGAPLPRIDAAPPASAVTTANTSTEQIAAAPPTATTPDRPTGSYMRIQVHAPTGANTTIAAAPPTNNNAPDNDGDPLRRARTLQRMERYKDAISAYREAIAAGAPTGDAYQNIAMCYQNIGDMANAKSAYQQAVSAYDAQIKSGRSASAALRGKQSCEAALEVLGG